MSELSLVAPIGVAKGAVLSASGEYRYRLTRVVDPSRQRVLFILLNPSTADAEVDDPTLRRCVRFSRSWGYGGNVEIVNLFALRSKDPELLTEHAAPIGPDNDRHLVEAVTDPMNALVICGWGRHGKIKSRSDTVVELLRPHTDLHVFHAAHGCGNEQLTASKQPKHPLYLHSGCTPAVHWKRKTQEAWHHVD